METRGFFQAATSHVGFLSSYDVELREPLLWSMGSPVSIQVARGSTALLSSNSRGIGPQDSLKGESPGLSRGVAGNPGIPGLMMVTSVSFSGCLWEVRNTVYWDGPLGTPLGLVLRKRAPSQVEVETSGLLSCSFMGLRLCILFQTGSQVSTLVEA